MKKYLLICLVACLCVLHGSPAFAQFARAFSNAPKGSRVFQFDAITSNSSTDDEDSLENIKTESRLYVPTLTYVIEGLYERSSGISISQPVVDMLSYDRRMGTVINDGKGLGDTVILFDHNFFGGKSMELEEFVNTPPGTYGGIHFALSLPTGDYSSSKASNIGTNRWTLKTTYQHSLAFNDAATWLDLYGYVKIFGDNDDYLGSNTLSQDALLGFEAYFSHNLSPTVFVEAGMAYTHGGAISINGTEQVEKQNTLNGLIGVKAPMWQKASIRFFYTPTLYDGRDGFVRGYSVRTTFQQTF